VLVRTLFGNIYSHCGSFNFQLWTFLVFEALCSLF